jgi:hypothetical protein
MHNFDRNENVRPPTKKQGKNYNPNKRPEIIFTHSLMELSPS